MAMMIEGREDAVEGDNNRDYADHIDDRLIRHARGLQDGYSHAVQKCFGSRSALRGI